MSIKVNVEKATSMTQGRASSVDSCSHTLKGY